VRHPEPDAGGTNDFTLDQGAGGRGVESACELAAAAASVVRRRQFEKNLAEGFADYNVRTVSSRGVIRRLRNFPYYRRALAMHTLIPSLAVRHMEFTVAFASFNGVGQRVASPTEAEDTARQVGPRASAATKSSATRSSRKAGRRRVRSTGSRTALRTRRQGRGPGPESYKKLRSSSAKRSETRLGSRRSIKTLEALSMNKHRHHREGLG